MDPFNAAYQGGQYHNADLFNQLATLSEESVIPYHDTVITDYFRQCKQPFPMNNGDLKLNSFQNTLIKSETPHAEPIMSKQQRRKRKAEIPKPVLKERQLRRNERERARQNRLNNAFDVLREALPSYFAPYKNGQKLTQIETLRLAKHYILSLKATLDEADKEDAEKAEAEVESSASSSKSE